MQTEPKKNHESSSLTSFLVHQAFPQVSEPYLADRFSESLANSSRKIEIIDRKNLAEYLTQNWTTLEDLKNFPGCRYIGRELGTTGIVMGSVHEQNGAIGLKIHLSGFGPSEESKSEFGDLDEVAWLSATGQTKDLLLERGPDYARKPEQIREAPDALRAAKDSVGMSTCVHCPDPPYADAARVAKVVRKRGDGVTCDLWPRSSCRSVIPGKLRGIREFRCEM